MDANRPVTEGRLRLMLGRLFPLVEDWEAIFAPAPEPPPTPPTPPPPVTVTGEKSLDDSQIAFLRQAIGSSEVGPLTGSEVDAVHAFIARKGK